MVASLENLVNAGVHKNHTVEIFFMTNKTLTDSIASLKVQNLKLIKLAKRLTSGTPAAANPNKDEKPPWDPTRYFWSHIYKIRTGHNSETCTKINPEHDTTSKR